MTIKYKELVHKVKKLNNFLVEIHTSSKSIDSYKQYICKLYFRQKVILSDSVVAKAISSEEDMENIVALFLEKVLEENVEIENICMANDISTKEKFRKITDKYFKNKESMKKLNEDQVEVLQSWVSEKLEV